MKVKIVSSTVDNAERVAQMVRATDPELDVRTAAGPAAGLPALINGSRPAVLILDGSDGLDLGGLDAVARLNHTHPDIDTIVISAEQSPTFLMKAMQSGVREVLIPPLSRQALQSALQRITRKHA